MDFIIRRNKKIIAIEVKSGKVKFHTGLEVFKKRFKPLKTILISEDSLSWDEFLKLEVNELFE